MVATIMKKGSEASECLPNALTEKICYETAPLALETLCHILQDPDIPHLSKLPAVKLALELERHQRKELAGALKSVSKNDREKTRQELEQEYAALIHDIHTKTAVID